MHPESQCPVWAIQCPVFVPQCPIFANERVYIDSLIHYSHLIGDFSGTVQDHHLFGLQQVANNNSFFPQWNKYHLTGEQSLSHPNDILVNMTAHRTLPLCPPLVWFPNLSQCSYYCVSFLILPSWLLSFPHCISIAY